MEAQRAVVVVGAGPSGVAAALAAAESGPAVLLDERPDRADPDALAAAGVEYLPNTAVWALFDGPVVAAFDNERALEIAGGAVVIATGGVERVWPSLGWERDDARPSASLGRLPDAGLALQARVASAFDRRALIERPLLAADGATSLRGVFVAGEAAGVTGDSAARDHGATAGRAAARVAAGGEQSTELAAPADLDLPPLPLPTDPATVIDRYQGVDLATLRAAIADGAFDVNDLRRRTRAGMGPGREILPVLAALMLDHDPAIPDTRLVARVRVPLRPLPFQTVLATERAS